MENDWLVGDKLTEAIKIQAELINIFHEEDAKFFGTTKRDYESAMDIKISNAIIQWLHERGNI